MPAEILFPFPPTNVKLSDLRIAGAGAGSDPGTDQPNIIKSTETFNLSVKVEFDPATSPFVQFLMGLGLTVEVGFQIEGFGTSSEVNLGPATITTTAGNFIYTPTFTGSAAGVLTPGVYEAAAVVTIKGGGIPLAFGFVSEIFFQVYA
jgi:hypothetical protein